MSIADGGTGPADRGERCWRPVRPGRWTPSDYGRVVPESISPIFRVAAAHVAADWYGRAEPTE
jgi:hypothetical protein